MNEFVNDSGIRLIFFVFLFVLFSVLEIFFFRRAVIRPLKVKLYNLGMLIAGTAFLRILGLIVQLSSAMGAAIWSETHQFGVFYLVNFPFWISLLLGIVILDFWVYLQHVIFHKFPIFWQIHRVHHSDLELDATTALRFHPLELAISMFLKVLIILVLGILPLTVLVFEIILNGMAMFNHANIRIPYPFEKWLRWLFVTPDMHRIHHSIEKKEHNHNFGFNLSIWDRLFRTYTSEPEAGHEKMVLGLAGYQASNFNLRQMFLFPFEKGK